MTKFAFLITALFLTSNASAQESYATRVQTGMSRVLASTELAQATRYNNKPSMIFSINSISSPTGEPGFYYRAKFLIAQGKTQTQCEVIAKVEGNQGTGKVSVADPVCY